MYKILLPTGVYLEGQFNLTFELSNQVFSTSDATVLPGSFSFPVEVPLTGANRAALGNPQLVTNARQWQTFEGVWVECYGVKMFYGTLKISACNRRSCKVTVVANPVASLKKIPMNELDLGGDRSIGNSAAMLAHAKDTTSAPLDYDYIFFPVFNDRYLDDLTSDDRCKMQNHWDSATSVFQVAADYPALMPFIRIEYLLSRIFADLDYTFVNLFQTDTETRSLCLYNNRSLWEAAGLSENINLQNHVSKTACTEFLRALIGNFNLGIFTNVFSRTIRLVPLRDLIARPPRHDWSRYHVGEYSIESPETVPDIFRYNDYDETQQYSIRFGMPVAEATFLTLEDLLSDPVYGFQDGYHYITGREAYYYIQASPLETRRIYDELGPAPAREGDVFECQLTPLHDFWAGSDSFTNVPLSGPDGAVPFCRIRGKLEYQPTGASDPIAQDEDIPDRILIYRGLIDDDEFQEYPAACCTTYDDFGNDIGTFSLRLQGERGMYATWWQTWHEMLRDGKHVVLQLALPIADLVAFSFEDKVRISNMDYFVKKLRVGKPLGRGKVLVEASLVSVI